MDAFAAELEACLAHVDSPGDVDEGATIALGAPLPAARAAKRHKPVSRWAIGSIAVGLLALAAVIVGLIAVHGIHGVGVNIGGSPAKAAPVHLLGVGSWDPYGDREEHSEAAPRATDKNQSTYWYTEHYRSFTKAGVGLVLDAGHAANPNGILISTDTPGFIAEIQAGDNPSGGFRVVSSQRTIDGTTTIPLDLHSAQRYFVVWITKLPPGVASVHVNEVTAS